MRSSDVTFKQAEVPIETRGTDDSIRQMDIIEIKYPDGKVVAFPADMKSPETGIRYRDMYPAKYKAFKNGEPDPDRVEQLQREIAERQAELDGMGYKAPDDERVRDNFGYGDQTRPDESAHDNTKRLPGEPDPGRIDQPVLLGTEPTVAEPQPAEPAKSDDQKVKEPA